EPPIRAHVTPHTFRRTYITYMVAAGYDLPYIQAQVGHTQPSTTLGIYAQLMSRPDRDQLRAEIRELLGVEGPASAKVRATSERVGVPQFDLDRLRASAEKAGKGRTLHL
ncbi:MAG TPA: tyrosine-type recombinase/integrase, partial [Solirubrobacteraceae bacterium]|nr:tyrosine-type recombinase/integrase [Solirubrobacteraceae bacterium]